jgi:glucose/mannose-6-phosphate isomerase
MKVDLDDADLTSRIDSHDMLGAVDRSPNPLLNPEAMLDQFTIPKSSITNLCIMGMGGSGSAGDVILDWLRPKLPVPAFVHREPELPASVNSKTLFVAISYSGNTSETLAAFQAARRRGAILVGVGTGGKLRDSCDSFKAGFVEVESSVAPRAALTQLVVGASSVLVAAGLVKSLYREMTETGRDLVHRNGKWRVQTSSKYNPAKRLASRIAGRFLVVYSLQRMSSVARRFKNQLAENCKEEARFDLLPEACHNEVEAWHDRGRTSLPFFIRDRLETGFEHSIVEAFRSTIMWGRKTKPVELSMSGRRGLSQLLSPILFLDYVSVYRAIQKGVDPTPTTFIESYKSKLRGRRSG